MKSTTSGRPSRRAIWIGTAAALLAGGAIVVMFVLPAEYGIDPTGVGKATGLIKIAEPDNIYLERGLKRKGVFTPSDTPPSPEPGAKDHWTFELAPYEGIELKYVIAEGKPVSFFWSATGPLNYDMHAHPFKGGTDLTESYSIEKRDHLGGRYVAAFTGIHGWHWQNRGTQTVRLTLDASGGITGSKIFDTVGEHDRELTPPAK
jgi:hypothetical protein